MPADHAKRAMELYEAARERNPGERSRYLDDACAGDLDLRQRVEFLLSCNPPSTFLGAPPSILAGDLRPVDDQGPDEPRKLLEPGTRIADFEIEESLGAGGMGEVYRARDVRLHRTVAIKILSARLRSSAAWRDRFFREARAISALNHPRICTLYDIGEQGGIDYLVMEYLDGETLADRLRRKPLTLNEALEYADQVSGALDAAHSAGILHRDLKPGNVMLTDAGAKVLDFGLAKSLPRTGSSRTTSGAATSATMAGMVLGTAAYMSPEQARGDGLNRQTDIWSFGCILYEMLCRRQVFGGRTHSDCIAACLEREPDWTALPASTPASVRVLLERCLRKDREFRLHDIADARIELRAARSPSALAAPYEVATKGPSRRQVVLLCCVFSALAAVVTGWCVWSFAPPLLRDPSPGMIRKLTIQLPERETLAMTQSLPFSVGRPSIALSPDGGQLVYAAEDDDTRRLYLRPLDDFDARPLDGTEGGFSPFFSPDGQWIGFFTKNRLHKISIRGGRPVTLCDEVLNSSGGAWGEDGTIVFSVDFGGRLMAIDGSSRAIRMVGPGRKDTVYRWPHFLPGKQSVMYCAGGGRVEILALTSSAAPTVIHRGGDYALYVRSGYLVLGLSGDLHAAPFDLERLELTGPGVPVVEDVRTDPVNGAVDVAVAFDGTLAYVPETERTAGGEGTLTWSDRDGEDQAVAVAGRRHYGSFSISPDGRRVAATVVDFTSQIWIYDVEGQRPPVRFTSEGTNSAPLWTPDGKRIVFTSQRDGRRSLFWKPVDSGGEATELLREDWSGGDVNEARDFSVEGVLLFDAYHPTTHHDIWTVRPGEEPSSMIRTTAVERGGAFSPDGQQIAFVSDAQVWVCSFPDGGTRWPVTTGGGEEPVWTSRNEIIYRDGDEWFAAPPTGGQPVRLFKRPFLNVPGMSYRYDAKRDRFLVVRGPGHSYNEIRVILNWREELERLFVPAKH